VLLLSALIQFHLVTKNNFEQQWKRHQRESDRDGLHAASNLLDTTQSQHSTSNTNNEFQKKQPSQTPTPLQRPIVTTVLSPPMSPTLQKSRSSSNLPSSPALTQSPHTNPELSTTRYSILSQEEHNVYLQLQQKWLKDQQAKATTVSASSPPISLLMNVADLALFTALRPFVQKEQDEYMSFLRVEGTTATAKQKYMYMDSRVESQLEEIFSKRRARVYQLPRFYDIRTVVDFNLIHLAPTDPVLKHVKTVLQIVSFFVHLPDSLTAFSFACRARCFVFIHRNPWKYL
jgi:hypothetical protein